MKPPSARPEDRRRQRDDAPAWADEVPHGLRSEAFAEDLWPAGDGAASHATPVADPVWPGRALGPSLGLALALASGLLRH